MSPPGYLPILPPLVPPPLIPPPLIPPTLALATLLDEAEAIMMQLWDDHPGFEVEPGTITLGEIQRRAAAFDPLELQIAPDVSAVSTNGWESLGSKGLALHLHWGKAAARSGRLSEILVLDTTRARTGGRRWRVLVDGKEMERFSRLEEAVEAVDYEVGRKGRAAAMSARPDAAWRAASVPSAVGKQLAELRPPRSASTHGEAVRYLAYAQHGPRGSAHPQRR